MSKICTHCNLPVPSVVAELLSMASSDQVRQTDTHTRTHARMHARTHARTHTHTHMHTQMHTCGGSSLHTGATNGDNQCYITLYLAQTTKCEQTVHTCIVPMLPLYSHGILISWCVVCTLPIVCVLSGSTVNFSPVSSSCEYVQLPILQ